METEIAQVIEAVNEMAPALAVAYRRASVTASAGSLAFCVFFVALMAVGIKGAWIPNFIESVSALKDDEAELMASQARAVVIVFAFLFLLLSMRGLSDNIRHYMGSDWYAAKEIIRSIRG